jgi:hypothetical protein
MVVTLLAMVVTLLAMLALLAMLPEKAQAQ